jgi:transcriptional regulator with XRE-family HTH domain
MQPIVGHTICWWTLWYAAYKLVGMQPELAFLANRIKRLRLDKKISQEDLAAKAGLSRNGMGLIEQGKRWPRLATLLKISDALGMTIEEVLKGIQKRKKRR